MTDETQETLRDRLRRHHEVILLGTILLIALALRLYQLEQDSFWIDELTQIAHSRVPFRDVFKACLIDEGSTPLDYLITHFVYYYIGRSEGILRLPAVLWGVLAVAAVYFLGRRMFDKTTGFLAAAILAILPSHIYYSQEVRPYSLPALMILLATFAFHHALQRNTRGAWALYGITLAVGMYAHYYVAVAAILHGAYLVLMALAKRLPWNRLLPYVIAAGVASLLFLPWVLADTFRSSSSFRWPALTMLLSAAFIPGDPSDSLGIFVWFAWASILAGIVMGIRGKSSEGANTRLIGTVAIMGMIISLCLDFLGGHFFPRRHFLPYVPVLALLIAVGALGFTKSIVQRLALPDTRGITSVLVTVLVVIFAVVTLADPLANTYRYKKQDWRGVGRYLLQHAKPGDAIILRTPHNVRLYAPELANQVVRLQDRNTILNAAQTHDRIWIIADWSTRFEVTKPDAAKWIKADKPLFVAGFSGVSLYLHSERATRQELEASLKQW